MCKSKVFMVNVVKNYNNFDVKCLTIERYRKSNLYTYVPLMHHNNDFYLKFKFNNCVINNIDDNFVFNFSNNEIYKLSNVLDDIDNYIKMNALKKYKIIVDRKIKFVKNKILNRNEIILDKNKSENINMFVCKNNLCEYFGKVSNYDYFGKSVEIVFLMSNRLLIDLKENIFTVLSMITKIKIKK